jgi:hypothetical protein
MSISKDYRNCQLLKLHFHATTLRNTSIMQSSPTTLVWVESITSDRLSDRSRVKRDVMQKVARRRERQRRNKHPNKGQLPAFLIDTLDKIPTEEQSESESQCFSDKFSHSDELHSFLSIERLQASPSSYSTLLAKYNLCIVDLSYLASLEVGRYTGMRLLERPKNITNFLSGRNWSYLRHVPLLYEQSTIVRNATDCVVARVRWLLQEDSYGSKWESLAISSYAKALSTLQKAMTSTPNGITNEVLCATEILGLYEVCRYLRSLEYLV